MGSMQAWQDRFGRGAVFTLRVSLRGGAAASQPGTTDRYEYARLASAGEDIGVLYAGGGTFSLPVSLPEGQVQLDFARPGGDAEVSVLVVSEELSDRAFGTAGVIGALVGAFILWRILRAIFRAVARTLRPRRPATA